MPGKNSFLIIALSAFLFVVATNIQAGWLFVLVSLLWGSLVLNLFLPLWTLRGLSARREVAPSATVGDRVRIYLTLRNQGKTARLLLSLTDPFPAAWGKKSGAHFLIWELPGAGSSPQGWCGDHEELCERRGCFSFPDLIVSCAAPFGFFTFRRHIPAPCALVVYPAPLFSRDHLLDPSSRVSPFSAGSAPLRGESDEFLGIREYASGDSLKSIHWASTGKVGRLMTKEFSRPGAGGVALLVETGRKLHRGEGKDCTIETAVRLAAGSARDAAAEGLSLFIPQREGGGWRESSFEETLTFLASIGLTETISVDSTVAQDAFPGPQCSALVIITPQLDRSLLGLAPLCRRMTVQVLLIENGSLSPQTDHLKESLSSGGLRIIPWSAEMEDGGRGRFRGISSTIAGSH
ncbi:MAG: DUF58 domain-containing protein [Armatimonadetes bacterium]|nr:DUF58 domain-containing protein [Armatimonadota bacterium]